MTISLGRRSFLAGLAAFGVGCRSSAPTGSVAPTAIEPTPTSPTPHTGPPRLLMLGGTGFLGPHLVREAVAAGFEVTLFNRGKTNPHLFEELEKLRGDRNDDLSALQGRDFEVVLDTSGYFPRQVEATASMLASSAEQYVFVSSISAYAGFTEVGMDESAPTAPMPEPYSEEMPTYYGPLKAGCERAAEAAMPGRTAVIRPGLIVGPGNPTDRFTYWPARVAKGGEVLTPGAPEDPVQFIDVRDLADWMIALAKQRTPGVFNATGPAEPTTIGALVQACKDVSGSDATFSWATAEFLAEHEVAPWMHMPVWVPPGNPESRGFARVSTARAQAAGLKSRPIAETIRATLDWWSEQPQERTSKLRAGIDGAREATLLAALRATDAAA